MEISLCVANTHSHCFNIAPPLQGGDKDVSLIRALAQHRLHWAKAPNNFTITIPALKRRGNIFPITLYSSILKMAGPLSSHTQIY
jgi:hypothetical protein